MTKVLVTGGTGFIGSNLIKELVYRGYEVRAFDNNFRGFEENLKDVAMDIELFKGDIRDPEAVFLSAKSIDHVYHLAFINGTEYFYSKPDLVMDVGIRGHFNIMDACKKNAVSKFIYASSSEVYQNPGIFPTPESIPCIVPDIQNARYSYGSSKILGEMLTLHYQKSFQLQRSIFRPHNIFGPAMGFEHVIPHIVKKIFDASDSLKKNEAAIQIQGSGKETRSFCYIDDAVEGILLVGERGADREIYHLGTNEEISIHFLIKKIASLLRVELNIETGPLQKGGTPRRCPDIQKLVNLGYHPNIDLDEGLKNTVEWYKNYFLKNVKERS